MRRDPRIGDRVAVICVESGRSTHEVFGTVEAVHSYGFIGIHWTAWRASVMDACDYHDRCHRDHVVGEWEGHCEDGDTCWCVPDVIGLSVVVVHNHESEAS